MSGKFFVIDGTDGSGKKTQIDILEKKLIEAGHNIKKVDFPRYGEFSAVFVEKYLNGYYGAANDVTAKQASIFYALDRFTAAKEMKQWLNQGHTIISNRFTSANVGHHGGKISDIAQRKDYINWLFELEFEILDIPRPDLTIFLHVPHEIGMELVKKKTMQRDYIEGDEEVKVDILEADKEHLKNAEESFLYAADSFDDWKTVTCVSNDELRPIEDISEEIWNIISSELA